MVFSALFSALLLMIANTTRPKGKISNFVAVKTSPPRMVGVSCHKDKVSGHSIGDLIAAARITHVGPRGHGTFTLSVKVSIKSAGALSKNHVAKFAPETEGSCN